ncbi:hypothetical protein TSUD_388230 [Trifolium subterraneum]|uniref:BHLH domain-containing protein n=1 Tax=Trifolium subterraneum TaxID=3900 RepID=A0A2Z6MT23_TRISU|nr:hypothetical protein TSUD_388230 [Trifolium subterraneum]
MAEEFQAGICGETWWNINNSTRSVFPIMMNSSSTCSVAANDVGNYSTWQNELLGLKETRTCSVDETNNNFDFSDCALSFLDTQKPQQSESSANGTGSMLIDSTLQIMGFDLSSPTSSNWNHSIFNCNGRQENNFHSVIQEETCLDSSNDSQIQVSTVDAFIKPMDQEFSIDQQSLNSVTSTAEALNDIRAGVLASSQPQYQSPNFDQDNKFNSSNALLNKLKREKSPETKNSSEAAVKRPRIETPSPLPTFKVRKEKLGDRITALQQLVSPFGKTDTASVLHEAIEYIKFLHDQVNVLSTPYMKNGSPIQHQQGCDNAKDSQEKKRDLRSQGLCLVPISSTFPMTNETPVDFWTPTFGGPLFGR